MAKMTAKYSGALDVAHMNGLSSTIGDQEALYRQLQDAGFFWNSQIKQWEEFDIEDANEPTGEITNVQQDAKMLITINPPLRCQYTAYCLASTDQALIHSNGLLPVRYDGSGLPQLSNVGGGDHPAANHTQFPRGDPPRMANKITYIHKMGAQVIIKRYGHDPRIYYPTRPSLQRLTRSIRGQYRKFCILPFLDGWSAIKPGYHRIGPEMLNICEAPHE